MQAAQEKFLYNQFLLFRRLMTTPAILKEVEEKLKAGDTKGVIELADEQIDRLGNALSVMFIEVGTAEAQNTALTIDPKLIRKQTEYRANFGINFDSIDPRAIDLMRQNKLKFVQRMTREQRQTIRDALAEGLQQGASTGDLARSFRDSIGLTPYQRKVVQNYQRALEQGNANALDRALRDRRFDSTVEQVVEGDNVLSAKQIERMVGRYTDRMIQQRAETIARTESNIVVEQARQEALDQTLDQAGIPREFVAKEWVTTMDGRERDSHAALDGVRRRMDEEFGFGLRFPGDPNADASQVINCRCAILYHFFDSEEELEKFLSEGTQLAA